MRLEMESFIGSIRRIIASHRLAPGSYARWLWGEERELGENPYGCADAANILYTIGDFPADLRERAAFVNAMQNMQDPNTGLFYESTHHAIHTTAHVTAALELFDAKPLHRFAAYDPYRTKDGLYALLDGLSWRESPWNNSHQGAGLYAAMKIAGESTPQWEKDYFDWLWQEADPVTGMWRKGFADAAPVTDRPVEGVAPLSWHMAGSFHYLFNCEHARFPLRYPEKMIDSCLKMYETENGILPRFGRMAGFMEIDWVFCIARALRQCGHRFEECRAALRGFAQDYCAYLMGLDPETDDGLNDLHMLFGVVCCLAELQTALPGELITDKPLHIVLDRRPFI